MNMTYCSTPELMTALSQETDALSTILPKGQDIAFIDPPMHINLGDLLIFLGAMDFFKANQNRLVAGASIFDLNSAALAAMERAPVFVCHGGGNFGDIYPRHQRLRETVIARFTDRPIIVMPQSFHFSAMDELKRSAAIFARHPNVTICVRDQVSCELASNHFTDKVLMLPDFAHRLYGQFAEVRERHADSQGEFCLTRRDVEAASHPTEGVDWSDLITLKEKIMLARHRLAAQARGRLGLHNKHAVYRFSRTVERVVGAAVERLAPTDHWKSNRLHGAILAQLLGKRVTLSDNSYGKNSRYFAQWFKYEANRKTAAE